MGIKEGKRGENTTRIKHFNSLPYHLEMATVAVHLTLCVRFTLWFYCYDHFHTKYCYRRIFSFNKMHRVLLQWPYTNDMNAAESWKYDRWFLTLWPCDIYSTTLVGNFIPSIRLLFVDLVHAYLIFYWYFVQSSTHTMWTR